jgi:mRNA interferase HigB
MHVITRKRLNEFAAAHPNAAPGLQHWYARMKAGSFRSFAELRTIYPSADQVGKLTVFNISGNGASDRSNTLQSAKGVYPRRLDPYRV